LPYLVYKIANDVNDKLYVGSTTLSLVRRWVCHIQEATLTSPRRSSGTSPIHQAIRAFGEEHFSIHLLEECPDKQKMIAAERRWAIHLTSRLPQGYNAVLPRLTSEDVAVIRFDAFNLPRVDYARLFGISLDEVKLITALSSVQRTHKHVTRDHLPHNIESYHKFVLQQYEKR